MEYKRGRRGRQRRGDRYGLCTPCTICGPRPCSWFRASTQFPQDIFEFRCASTSSGFGDFVGFRIGTEDASFVGGFKPPFRQQLSQAFKKPVALEGLPLFRVDGHGNCTSLNLVPRLVARATSSET